MRYYIIAGEASGDLHGSNLIKELKLRDQESKIRAWGGDLMEAAGAVIVKHYRDLAFMGFTEVLINLRTILSNLKFCKKDLLQFKPDVIILIDYPGFNLRIAKFAKKNGIKVFYYISPQIWAWNESRVKIVKESVDKMFVILPFEKAFYQKHSMEVDFVGHPLLDALENSKQDAKIEREKAIVLLPGSRVQEIKKMLPIMLQAALKFKEYKIIIAAAPSISPSVYHKHIHDDRIEVFQGKTYELLSRAHAALVTSGTATLEAALFGVPEVVCYKGGYVSYRIAKALIKVKFISLVNLIMGEEIVKELIQSEFNSSALERELATIISGPKRDKMLLDFDLLKTKLGGPGASAKAAVRMVKYLK